MYHSFRVLDAVEEGTISGIITCLKYQEPDITNKLIMKDIDLILSHWERKKREYWYNWFGLM